MHKLLKKNQKGFTPTPKVGVSLQSKRGFTLIEILVVIGIIAILAAIVIIAINPARQFAQARNSQRTSNVNAILNAIGQRIADNKGVFPGSFSTGSGTTTCPTLVNDDIDLSGGGAGLDLSCLAPTYMPSFPTDPNYANGPDTLYNLTVDGTGRVTVCAPNGVESAIPGSAEICVTR